MRTRRKLENGQYIIEDHGTLEDFKRFILSDFAERTSSLIKDAGLDPITQQNSALGIYPPERCEAIKNYIAACRNEYLRCKALILTAQTNDEADAVQFLAPPVPEGM